MDVCVLCLYVVLFCVGKGLCDGLITRPEESYHVSKCMCDHRNPERGPIFQLGTYRKNECIGKRRYETEEQKHIPVWHTGIYRSVSSNDTMVRGLQH
jgi:hypothetical protein